MSRIQRKIQASIEKSERTLSEYIASVRDDETLEKLFTEYDDIVNRNVVVEVAPLIIEPYHKNPDGIVLDFLMEAPKIMGHNLKGFMNWYCDSDTIRAEIATEKITGPT